MTPGFKPFTILRSLGQQGERLANNYISYASNVRRIRQQLWFNHRCKDLGLVPSGLRLKSPLNTQEAIQIVKATCRRLIRARINDCNRRLNHYNNRLQQRLDKLKQLIPTNKTETQVLSYGLKHSVTPKRIPTETIVSSVEEVLSRQRELSEPTKANIRSRIASTIQSASLTDNNLTKDKRQGLKRLRNDNDILILPADKGRVTAVMDKTDYHDKMDELLNDKQTYEVLKRDPTPALQRKLNSKLLQPKKADAIDIRRYNRLRCPVPQPAKLYGLPKLHKPNFPMRPIVRSVVRRLTNCRNTSLRY